MKTKYPMFFIGGYAAIWLSCWGIMMADIQAIGSVNFAAKYYRKDLAATCLLAVIPIANIAIAVFGTGFAEHGWRLSRRTE